jgi:hypothetical protein
LRGNNDHHQPYPGNHGIQFETIEIPGSDEGGSQCR